MRRNVMKRWWMVVAAGLAVGIVLAGLGWWREAHAVATSRGGLGMTGYYPGRGLYARPAVRWMANLHGGIIPPVIAGNTLYATGDHLYAVDARSGSVRWQFGHTGQLSGPLVLGESVYVGEGGALCALNRRNGKLRWRAQPWQSRVPHRAADSAQALYLTDQHGTLYAVDRRTGDLCWSGCPWTIRDRDSYYAIPPTVSADTVYMGNFRGVVYALDARTGAERWHTALGGLMTVNLVAAHGLIYAATGKGVFALDARTGRRRWQYATRHAGDNPPAVDADTVYLAGRWTAPIVALNARTGKLRWTHAAARSATSVDLPPVVTDGNLYITNLDGLLSVYDTKTGAERWRFRNDSILTAPPIIAGNTLYIYHPNGTLYALRERNAGDPLIERLRGMLGW